MAREPKQMSIPFPILGLDENTSYREQPEKTTRDMVNLRAWDTGTGRIRGGPRGGISKYNTSQISGSNRIQCLDQVVTTQTGVSAPGSMSTRTVTRLAVCNGRIRTFNNASTVSVPVGVVDPDLNAASPVIFSASLYGVTYFVDGTNYRQYTASTDTVADWTASVGSMPSDAANTARLIEMWRGRLVLAGIKSDSHNYFMTRAGSPRDLGYATDTDMEEGQAFAGNNAPFGKIGEPINTVVPYNNDILLFGLDSQIWSMSGDPTADGRVDLLSNITGMAWGRPWCQDPNGVLYFFGSRGGLYRMIPGSKPERLSAKRLERTLSTVNFNTHIVRLAWNDEEMGVHIFITPLVAATAYHYYFDARTESFYKDRFNNTNHSPVSMHVFDGDEPEDRAILLGGSDGYVRRWTRDGRTDDGTQIDGYVMMGPIQIEDGKVEFILSELQAVLSEGSDDVTYEIYVGNSAEHAMSQAAARAGLIRNEVGDRILLAAGDGFLLLESDASNNVDSTGIFEDIRSVAVQPRLRGYAAYVKLKNTGSGNRWALEELRAKLQVITTGRGRRS